MTPLAKARILGYCQQCRSKPAVLGKSRCDGCAKKARLRYAAWSKNPAWRKKNAKRAAAWEKANPERKNANVTRHRNKLKKAVMDHYGHSCKCCGETEKKFLTIDHVNGGGTKHRAKIGRGSCDFHRWLVKNNFPSEYQVLCFNCNCAKGIYGICPHKE